MNISHFCIDRPIFASVISIVITLGGTLAMFSLPIAQYPDITPPPDHDFRHVPRCECGRGS
jgi:multidrug efflux pump